MAGSLVYLSAVPWFSFEQRPQKFVRWAHGAFDGDIHWIEPYPTRLPQLADLKRASAPPLTITSNEVPDWLHIHRVKALPIEPVPAVHRINATLWRRLVETYKDLCAQTPAVLVIGKPSRLARALMALGVHKHAVYDAMDDFPAFYKGMSRRALERSEHQIATHVDEVWASSTALLQKFEHGPARTRLIHNGFEAVTGPLATTPTASAPPQGKRVFGYLGTIAEWFDWEWILHLAQHYPQDEIRIIGPMLSPFEGTLPSNVTLHPATPQSRALTEMRQFDVGLIPFQRTQLIKSVDPVKYYEYRSLGLSVLSTDFGEMSYRSEEPGVFLTRQRTDVVEMAGKALAFRQNPKDVSDFITLNSWAARFSKTELFKQGFTS